MKCLEEHIKNKIFYYPPGAGGHWVMHVLYCLISNSFETYDVTGYNSYHNAAIIPLLDDEHWNYQDKENSVIIDDFCLFNFYINFVEKYINKNFENIEHQYKAAHKILEKLFNWQSTTKNTSNVMFYTDIWKNQNQFKKKFIKTFKDIGIDIVNNEQKEKMFDQKIIEFKSSIPNVLDYYNQDNNIFWLAWCNFILIHYKILPKEKILLANGTEFSSHRICELQNIVDKYLKQCLTITNNLIYFYPEYSR